MKYKVLISPNTLLPVFEDYRHFLEEKNIYPIIPKAFNEFLNEEQLLPLVSDIDGAICGDDRYSERVLKKAKKLKVLSKWGEGIDAIDINAAKKLDIKVFRTPGALTNPVADTVLGYMLLYARNLNNKDKVVRDGYWNKLDSVTLDESILGIVGFGKIGQAIAKRALSFGTEIIFSDIKKIDKSLQKKLNVKQVSFDELITKSDFISLNCDLNKTSRKLIDFSELDKMKNSCYLINTARGQLINERALINALDKKIIGGAALDVFEIEPLPKNNKLRNFNNCLFSPHNANASPKVFDSIHKQTIQNLFKGLGIN